MLHHPPLYRLYSRHCECLYRCDGLLCQWSSLSVVYSIGHQVSLSDNLLYTIRVFTYKKRESIRTPAILGIYEIPHGTLSELLHIMYILYHIKRVLSTVNFGYFKVFHLTNALSSVWTPQTSQTVFFPCRELVFPKAFCCMESPCMTCLSTGRDILTF